METCRLTQQIVCGAGTEASHQVQCLVDNCWSLCAVQWWLGSVLSNRNSKGREFDSRHCHSGQQQWASCLHLFAQ